MSEHLPQISEHFYEQLSCWDRATVRDFIHGHRQLFNRIAAAQGLPYHERDDFSNDCFKIIVKIAARYDASKELWPWVATIAWNQSRNHLRKLARRSAQEKKQVVEAGENAVHEAVDFVIQAESLQQVQKIIEALRKAARERASGMREQTIDIGVLMMKGEDPEEIARMYNKSVSYVGVVKARMIKAIQERLPKQN
jgi:RNA polymerase sigma factor (sigma-70 family)